MPWATPVLKDVRIMVRDSLRATLPGSDANVPNSLLRIMSDAMAALAHLTLQYLDWLRLQLLPTTAEHEFLDRHGFIWLVNADGSKGRKLATLAIGSVTVTGQAGVVVPLGSILANAPTTGVQTSYETLEELIIGLTPSPVAIRALDPGVIGNMTASQIISFNPPLIGVDRSATVVVLSGGTDDETDDELRARVLQRIQEPPMGGDATDYVYWTTSVPGVTRAWSYPLEQGMGTVTTRFMMDHLRADNNGGFPLEEDVQAVEAFLDTKRPVAVKDVFVVAPIPFPISFTIHTLVVDNAATRQAIQDAVQTMLFEKAIPGSTIYASWIEAAIADAVGVDHFELVYTTTAMPSPGHLAILGSIIYAP